MAADESAAELVDVERDLGDQHRRRSPGDPRMGSDPPGVAAHHLDEHHPVVALGGRVQAVDRIGGDLHGGVEAERQVGTDDVVVDRLRHADDRQAELGVQVARDAQAPVATDDDQAVEPEVGERALDPFDAVVGVERAPPPGTEHRPAAREQTAHRLDRERRRPPLHHAVPRVEEADDLVAVRPLALADDRTDHRVQPGAVAAAGEDSDSHESRWYGRATADSP